MAASRELLLTACDRKKDSYYYFGGFIGEKIRELPDHDLREVLMNQIHDLIFAAAIDARNREPHAASPVADLAQSDMQPTSCPVRSEEGPIVESPPPLPYPLISEPILDKGTSQKINTPEEHGCGVPPMPELYSWRLPPLPPKMKRP